MNTKWALGGSKRGSRCAVVASGHVSSVCMCRRKWERTFRYLSLHKWEQKQMCRSSTNNNKQFVKIIHPRVLKNIVAFMCMSTHEYAVLEVMITQNKQLHRLTAAEQQAHWQTWCNATFEAAVIDTLTVSLRTDHRTGGTLTEWKWFSQTWL